MRIQPWAFAPLNLFNDGDFDRDDTVSALPPFQEKFYLIGVLRLSMVVGPLVGWNWTWGLLPIRTLRIFWIFSIRPTTPATDTGMVNYG